MNHYNLSNENVSKYFLFRKPVGDPLLTFVYFPHAGASPGYYFDLFQFLPADVAIIGIRIPGREHSYGDPPLRHWKDLLAFIETVVLQKLHAPCILFGHSLGGAIAYETAVLLQQSKQNYIQEIIISGCVAPQSTPRENPISMLPLTEFKEQLIKIGAMDSQIIHNEKLFLALEPILRADISLADQWHRKKNFVLDAPIHLCSGLTDPLTPIDQLNGWQTCSQLPTQKHFFQGNHFYFDQSRFEFQKFMMDTTKARIQNLKLENQC